jgi:hypothetical protein
LLNVVDISSRHSTTLKHCTGRTVRKKGMSGRRKKEKGESLRERKRSTLAFEKEKKTEKNPLPTAPWDAKP